MRGLCSFRVGLWLALLAAAGCGEQPMPPTLPRQAHSGPGSGRRALAVRGPVVIGRSVRGRAIVADALGSAAPGRAVLVVGAIHGDEPAGIAVVRWLMAHRVRSEAPLWVVADLNPDGVAAGTRQNARSVDLNRNFPYLWARRYRPGDQQYQGPRALSETEAVAAYRLILRLRPRITIWFHQPLAVVDLSGGEAEVERSFARRARLRVRRLTRYPGSAAGWQNHQLRGSTAFVVELPPGRLPAAVVARLGRAVLALAELR